MSNVLDSVQAADRRDRALRNDEESLDSADASDDARAPSISGPASRQTSNASGRGQRVAAYESDSQDTDEEDAAFRMPPPPLPLQRRKFDAKPAPSTLKSLSRTRCINMWTSLIGEFRIE